MTPGDLTPEWRAWYEERAAIIEYESTTAKETPPTRQAAEAKAFFLTLLAMRKAKT